MERSPQEDEYYYETKALVLQYLGLVPGGLSDFEQELQQQYNLPLTLTGQSGSSNLNLGSQSSEDGHVSDDETSQDLSLKSDETDGLSYPLTSSAKSSPQKKPSSKSTSPKSSHTYAGAEGGDVSFPEGISIIEPNGIDISTANDTSNSGYYTPGQQMSSSYSESFLSADSTLVDKNWHSTDNLSSGRRRRVSREELTANSQSDGHTHIMRNQLSSPTLLPQRRHAASDPPQPSAVFHARHPIADRSSLLLNLQPTSAHIHSPDSDMDRGAYLEYLHNEFEEVKKRQTPKVLTPMADVLQSPEAEVAKMLDSISAEVMKTYGSSIHEATRRVLKESMVQMTYEDFRSAGDSLVVHAPPGIHRISLALCFSRQIAQALLMRGGQSLKNVTDYSVQFVANTAANFILERGGWTSITDLELESSPESPFPPESYEPFPPLTESVVPQCTTADLTNETLLTRDFVDSYTEDSIGNLPSICNPLNESSRSRVSDVSNISTGELTEDYQEVMSSYMQWGSAFIGVFVLAIGISYAVYRTRGR